MGYLRHETIVVSHWSVEELAKVHGIALAIFNDHKMGTLVSGIVQHIVNGGAAFFIAPDGSKEGWEPSDRADSARSELIDILKGTHCEWAHVLLGGDDGEYRVLDSRADEAEAA